ncbi:prepilin peptidase [Weissella fangxianensis]|uniref:prepilin peptidase n=1 Tax=Weissella fangxianensis TaxID=2953879 RepID=UPI002157185D|nr:prepilin peptidase [Weissella fangxianensis]
MLLDFLLLLTMCLLSYQDFKEQTINSLWLLFPLLIAALFYHSSIWLTFSIYCLCLTINTLNQEHFIGNGDLDILAVLSLYVNFEQFWYICTIACAYQLAYHSLTHKQALDFVPAITIGYLTCLLPQIFAK